MDTDNKLKTVYHKFHIDIQIDECTKNQIDFAWMQHNHSSNITNGILRNNGPMNTTAMKQYPYKATYADWISLKELYPFLQLDWFHLNEPKLML